MNILIVFAAKYLIYISVAIALVWFFCEPREKKKEILLFAAVLLPVSYAVAKVAGHFFFDPRPFVAGNFTPLIPHVPDNGFPSDHALAGAAIAFAIFRFNKKIGAFLLLLAVLVGAARVAAGVHHAVDIAASVAIAFLVFAALRTKKVGGKLFPRLTREKSEK